LAAHGDASKVFVGMYVAGATHPANNGWIRLSLVLAGGFDTVMLYVGLPQSNNFHQTTLAYSQLLGSIWFSVITDL
jgi:hypothetical protein